MKMTRKIIEIDEELCNGCGECVTACAEGAIQVVNGKARLVSEIYCDGLGMCLGHCPVDALKIVERDSEEFDEQAVKTYLDAIKQPAKPVAAGGCPGSMARTMTPAVPMSELAADPGASASALGNWPIQIHLISANAPYLQGAKLLVAADCVPVAYARFHEDFLAGKVVTVGCPKLDATEAYVQKFANIFRIADIQSVTAIVMEVPCCQGLPSLVAKGMALAGKSIPIEKIVIGIRGQVLRREQFAA